MPVMFTNKAFNAYQPPNKVLRIKSCDSDQHKEKHINHLVVISLFPGFFLVFLFFLWNQQIFKSLAAAKSSSFPCMYIQSLYIKKKEQHWHWLFFFPKKLLQWLTDFICPYEIHCISLHVHTSHCHFSIFLHD